VHSHTTLCYDLRVFRLEWSAISLSERILRIAQPLEVSRPAKSSQPTGHSVSMQRSETGRGRALNGSHQRTIRVMAS
jgi:hypothetical protein